MFTVRPDESRRTKAYRRGHSSLRDVIYSARGEFGLERKRRADRNRPKLMGLRTDLFMRPHSSTSRSQDSRDLDPKF